MTDRASWIKRVAAVALERFDETMQLLGLHGGKRQGREYLPLNPNRADHKPGSFSINLDSGAWMDGASGDKGGDLVALAAFVWQTKQGEAGRKLAAQFGVPVPESTKGGRSDAGSAGRGQACPPPVQSPVAPSRGHGEASGGGAVCLMPIPADAPPPPAAHSRHGKPVKRWAYVDAAGVVCFYHDRYEPPGERKQFAPLTLWRGVDGRLTWQFKAPPAPRPLLGLDRLAASPSAPVMVVEGEKAADAAAGLLPGWVVVCWQGGAQAVERADWSPLAGRDVALWPDADEPGADCMGKLARLLTGQKAARVRLLDLAQLAQVAGRDDAGAPVLSPGPVLGAGDDAADLVARGWAADHVALVLDRPGFLVDVRPALAAQPAKPAAPAAEAVPARRFILEDAGVYFLEPDKSPRWVCPPLEVVALVRDPHGEGWGKLVRFRDPDGSEKRRILPDAMLSGDGTELERTLRGAGLKVAPSGRPLLRQYLIEAAPEDRARVTDRTGWHECQGGGAAFVLPSVAFGQGGEAWIFQTDAPASHAFRQRGTLDEWRQEVAARCAGNTRLVFAVCVAFASPLLHVAGAESGGFHLRSGSSDGKTTCLRVGASVCGGADYMQRWRATDNGLAESRRVV